ncbi:hypothetical protein SAMN05444920_107196 [Nonomuraea solani]|uniref:DUF5655 domain-containing protein n=1 Tax=Nonomuraea solani TaxID=1144553 RepID=A0A1H6E0H1_9ACTN|nr:DUF5655 domain-containing protein [Nonomuraea solani]SEG91108.1 hypothetical protein SAMN05444920_107196 [Nonomuraea solani]
MTRWTCPQCDREFGRTRQSHVCVPGCTVEETFAPYPPVYREIYDRLVEDLGPIHEDAVRVGVFLKSGRTFAEIRPKARSLTLALVLSRRVEHPLIARALPAPGGSVWHFFKLTRVADVDERIIDFMAEAHDG